MARECLVKKNKRMDEKMVMKNAEKYKKQYFMPPQVCMDWAKKESV